ncbi:MAG: cellulase family glycosylhydrolase [Acidimicrobiia bacterium]|nr:cellulase family glycosylhydrolase [Acidimicrobiia bacterium]
MRIAEDREDMRRSGRGAAASILLALLVSAASLTTPPAPAQVATPAENLPAPGWVHVEHPATGRPYLADEGGREVVMRGTNATGIYENQDDVWLDPDVPDRPTQPADYDGACPDNVGSWSNPPLCQVDAGHGTWVSAGDDSRNDLSQMRALGFDVVRLCVSWSLVEPDPGAYDPVYVERIAQVVDWAREQGIHVLVDFHQDQYGDVPRTPTLDLPPLFVPPSGQNDGAPRWAVMTDGLPSIAVFGQNVLNPAVFRAFDHFWRNDVPPVPQGDAPGPGLQDHFIGAFARVVARLQDDPAVMGFEIMNEPQPGSYSASRFNSVALYPFYRRVVEAVTGVRDGLPDCPAEKPTGDDCAYPDLGIRDTRHVIAFEPNAFRNVVDFAPGTHRPFSEYPNLLYAPHVYSYIFTIPSVLGASLEDAWWPPGYAFAYVTADREARALDAALFIGEFGGTQHDNATKFEGTIAQQERYAVGGTLWDWKVNCRNPAGCDEEEAWTVYRSGGPGAHPPQNGPLQPERVRHVARVVPRATSGRLRSYRYDPWTEDFRMQATAAGAVTPGDRDLETVVYIPSPVEGAVTAGGDAEVTAVVTNPDGSRLAYVAPTGAGNYTVSVD